jgi:hypothetical protein
MTIWASISKSQCFGNDGCPSGTTTGVTQPCPSSNDFHKNTFDWTQPTIPAIAKPDFSNFIPYGPYVLPNPYYTPGPDPYIANIAQGAQSDFQPSDGWELVKQDFGYYYDATANVWNGTPIQNLAFTTGVNNTTIAYFMLYNKYTGVLRIFADFPFSGGIEYSNIEVTIAFIGSDGTSSTANYVNFKPSALFNAYNNLNMPLDQQTTASSATTWAYMVTDKSHFCYADFQLSYDPCTCFFNQGLQVTFRGVQTANLNLIGRYEGVGTNDPALLDVANAQGTLYGSNLLDTFLTSVLNTAPNNSDPGASNFTQANILAFEKSTSNVAGEIADQYVDNQNVQNVKTALNVVFTVLQAAIGVAGDGSSGPSGPSGPSATNSVLQIAKTVKDVMGQAAPAVNFYNTGLTAGTQTSIMWGSVALTGTSYASDDLNGISYAFATPGSAMGATAGDQLPVSTPPCPTGCDPANAYNMPEYGGAVGGGQWPDAPIYNEVPGLIALKSTPTVNRFIGDPATLVTSPTNFTLLDGTQSQSEGYSNRPIEYQFNENSLQVLYSPYINAATTQIYAALEIQGIPVPFNVLAFNTLSDPVQEESFGPGYTLDAATNMTDITGLVHGLSTTNRTYMTPFVPVNCLGQIITQEMFDFSGLQSTEKQLFSGMLDGSGATQIGTTPAQPFSLINQTVTLVFQVYYEFNENSYGITKHTFQIVKFPVTINPVTTQLSTQPQFAELANIPNNLILSSLPSTLPIDGIIYSQGTITITGNLTLPSGSSPIIIRAQNGINVNPGVTIGPGITLQIQSFLPICDNFSSAAITPVTVDASFCNSSNYQANQALQKLNIPDTTKTIANSDFKINLYPNPTNSECTVRFTESSGANVTITLVDIMGRDVATIDQSWHNQGTSFVPFSTERYAPGVYTVRFSDGTNTSTQRLTITGK